MNRWTDKQPDGGWTDRQTDRSIIVIRTIKYIKTFFPVFFSLCDTILVFSNVFFTASILFVAFLLEQCFPPFQIFGEHLVIKQNISQILKNSHLLTLLHFTYKCPSLGSDPLYWLEETLCIPNFVWWQNCEFCPTFAYSETLVHQTKVVQPISV